MISDSIPWVRGPCRCGFGPHAWLWATEERPYAYVPPPCSGYPLTKEDERRMLKSEHDLLRRRVEEIERRLKELREEE